MRLLHIMARVLDGSLKQYPRGVLVSSNRYNPENLGVNTNSGIIVAQLRTCIPLPRGGVNFSIHFLSSNRFGVEATVLVGNTSGFIQRCTQTPVLHIDSEKKRTTVQGGDRAKVPLIVITWYFVQRVKGLILTPKFRSGRDSVVSDALARDAYYFLPSQGVEIKLGTLGLEVR